VNAALVIAAAVVALPVLLLVGFFLGPVALVLLLIVACAAPVLLVVGAILLYSGKRQPQPLDVGCPRSAPGKHSTSPAPNPCSQGTAAGSLVAAGEGLGAAD
jgi:hypothetical protein